MWSVKINGVVKEIDSEGKIHVAYKGVKTVDVFRYGGSDIWVQEGAIKYYDDPMDVYLFRTDESCIDGMKFATFK